ncbi:hypothetical protein VST7929_02794 [Vibrio stylophorae]|uniref:Uncharacterized protein n=1 Tax=Vibrio stylophorae TaxID=659351 RepID=A0ABN8DXM2_9VIBR|nr:hypothetical protein [Vibrio stylophorae]CAH0535133.1 hypothetical protein VST7929_02794 [Vibrio stylophorae]
MRFFQLRPRTFCLAFTLITGTVFAQDDVGTALKQSQAHYQQGQLLAASTALEQAHFLIFEQALNEIAARLPALDTPWQRDPHTIDHPQKMLGLARLEQRYYDPQGHQIMVRVLLNNPLQPLLKDMLETPQLVQAMGAQRLSFGKAEGILLDSQCDACELQIMAAPQMTVVLEGSAGTRQQLLLLAKKMDFSPL